MKKTILFFCLIILLTNISASCNNQIDINSASKEELMKITYIGEVRAEQLIELRPFESIDELTKIKGIGEVYLNKIKEQDLACINDYEEKKDSQEGLEDKKEPEKQEEVIKQPKVIEPITPEIIQLNPKTIKSEDDNKKIEKSNYTKYGFVIFCVLLGSLFIIRKKRFNKNEFD